MVAKISSLAFSVAAVGIAFLVAVSGCGKKTVAAQTNELEKAFPVAAAPAPSAPQSTAPAPPSDPNSFVKLALAAVHTNDYAAGVIALQAAQRMRGVTAQQLMAIESAKQSLTAELQLRADRGDAKAKSDLAAIEKTRSQ